MKFSLLICSAAFYAAASFGATTLKEVGVGSKFCTYQGTNGAVLPYRMLEPEVTPGEKYPLVVFLHGAGERGTNNISQLVHVDALNLMYARDANGEMKQIRKSYVIFPQCKNGSQWVLVPWSDKAPTTIKPEPSEGLQNVHELVAKLKAEFPIDASRVYVTGISMGGYGTWDYITRWPNEVAAAIVVCGGADNETVKARPEVRNMPIRIFHGSLDNAVPCVRGRDAFAAIRDVNANATYTEYGKAFHGIWKRAYSEPGLGEWLFGFKKDQKK